MEQYKPIGTTALVKQLFKVSTLDKPLLMWSPWDNVIFGVVLWCNGIHANTVDESEWMIQITRVGNKTYFHVRIRGETLRKRSTNKSYVRFVPAPKQLDRSHQSMSLEDVLENLPDWIR